MGQLQAKRMFCRFFGKEAQIDSIDSKCITTKGLHGFQTEDIVMYKRSKDIGCEAMLLGGVPVADRTEFVVNVVSDVGLDAACSKQLQLYDVDGQKSLQSVSMGRNAKLTSIPRAAERFGSRIPPGQISMAKLQGYLMTQKLAAEQDIKRKREKNELPQHLNRSNLGKDQFNHLLEAEIVQVAQDLAIMNVHELLDVKRDVEDVKVPIYDHLRRVGLHHYAPLFEHFGVNFKNDLNGEITGRLDNWSPDFKVGGPQRDRLADLIKGAS